MARRKNQLFNLSFLDLLTSALGAIIFLFIITPKGGQSAADVRQATVYIDTTQMKIFGDLDDSLRFKRVGDTLLTVLVDYKTMPVENKEPKKILASNERPPEPPKRYEPIPAPKPTKVPEKKIEQPKPEKKEEKKIPETKDKTPVKAETPKPPTYKGDAPSVPSSVSFEVSWQNKDDNIDLFVCKGRNCVYGGRKNDKKIGQWDSGKSRNRLFGNDLRTNMEAVRQFDKILPGEYKIYAQYKESKRNRAAVTVDGLIYTKDENNVQRGESFSKRLKLGADRVLLGTVILQANGNYKFKTN